MIHKLNGFSTSIKYNGTECKVLFTLKPLINLKLLNLAQTSIKVQLNKNNIENNGYIPLKNVKNFKQFKYPKSTNINKILYNKNKLISNNSYNKVMNHILDTLTVMVKNYIQKERVFLQNTNLLNGSLLKEKNYNGIKRAVYKLLDDLSNKANVNDKKIDKLKNILKNYNREFKNRFKNKHTSNSPFVLILSLKNRLNKII